MKNREGQGEEVTGTFPLELVSPELRFSNTDVWLLVTTEGDWRTGEQMRTKYEVLPR